MSKFWRDQGQGHTGDHSSSGSPLPRAYHRHVASCSGLEVLSTTSKIDIARQPGYYLSDIRGGLIACGKRAFGHAWSRTSVRGGTYPGSCGPKRTARRHHNSTVGGGECASSTSGTRNKTHTGQRSCPGTTAFGPPWLNAIKKCRVGPAPSVSPTVTTTSLEPGPIRARRSGSRQPRESSRQGGR
jgi:hypothetical protein